MTRALIRARHIALTFAVIVVSACDSNEPGPLAGAWVATTLTVTRPGFAPINALAAGATLTINIASDNSTTGTLFVPGSLTFEGDAIITMVGTAVRSGNTVTFTQAGDSFVRDMTFTLGKTTMEGSYVSQGDDGTINVVLTRQ